MKFLENLLANTEISVLSALILGLMTAISPCPLATNITAIGYISKDMHDRKKVFWNGVVYTFGRAITYTSIGLIFFFGANQFKISGFINNWGEKLLGPLLIIIGIFLLDIIKIKMPGNGKMQEKITQKKQKGFLDYLLLGIVFALAFCPYSGVLYFGMLIPMTVSSASGLYLPLVFAIATGLPVIIIAWLIAFSISNVGKFYNNMKTFENWFRKIVAIIFILVGLYYVYIFYIQKFL